MSHRPQVFISSTSHDLAAFRDAVAKSVLKTGATPVFEEAFKPEHDEVVAVLTEKIKTCQAVICLIGPTYGAELKPAPICSRPLYFLPSASSASRPPTTRAGAMPRRNSPP